MWCCGGLTDGENSGTKFNSFPRRMADHSTTLVRCQWQAGIKDSGGWGWHDLQITSGSSSEQKGADLQTVAKGSLFCRQLPGSKCGTKGLGPSDYCLRLRRSAGNPWFETRNKGCGPAGLTMCLYHFFKK